MTKQLIILLPLILITATVALVAIRSFVLWKLDNRRIRNIELGDLDKSPDPNQRKKFESKTPIIPDPRSRKKLRW